jgi:TPR repeat protein
LPVRASVLPQPTPGHAILRVGDLDAPPEGLTLSIQRQQGPDSHLGEDGWRRTEAWLRPDQVVRVKGMLDFHLGPAICDRLAGIATARLRIKEPDIGVVASTVVAWPAMLTSGAVDATSKPAVEESPFRFRRPPPTVQPPPAPPFEPEPAEPPRPIPELRAAREPAPPAARSGVVSWLATALALIVVAGAGYYVYTTYFQKNGTQMATTAPPASTTPAPAAAATPAETPAKSIRDTVAEYLATKPSAEAMLAKGQEYAAAGNLAGAFLVWRQAAASGNPQAEVEIAEFFDPLAPRPKTGFTPDGARAADWYERAALAGNAEAQRKLGLLYAMGAAGVPADPAKAKSWLQQAANQNDVEARKALEQLSKK